MPEEKKKGLAYECLQNAVDTNTAVNASCKAVLVMLEKYPELDQHLCKAFGLRPMPKI